MDPRHPSSAPGVPVPSDFAGAPESQAGGDGDGSLADLIASEDQYLRLVVSSSAVGQCLVTVEGRILRPNPALCTFLARTTDELASLTWHQITHPDDLAGERRLMEQIMSGETGQARFTKRFLRSDGTPTWGDLLCVPLRGPDGSIRGFVSQVVDVNETVTARQELAESQERYRLLAENASDVVTRTDPDGHIEWVSPSVRMVLGWEPGEILGRTTLSLIHPEDLPRAEGRAWQVLSGHRASFRLRVRRKSGAYTWVDLTSRPIHDGAGTVIGRVAGWRDASAEVAAERLLADSESHFRMVAENSSDVVVRTGADRIVDWVSPSVCEVLGWEPAAVEGTWFPDHLHPEDIALLVAGAGSDPVARNLELRVRAADGRYCWMSTTTRTLLDGGGVTIGMIHALRDITSEREAREELRHLAYHDPLTGVATRPVAYDRLRSVLTHEPRASGGVGVLFADVDNLKDINDKYGHAAGDRVIAHVATTIAGMLRADDLVARFGGDEFVVVLGSVAGPDEAALVSDKLHQAVARPVRVDHHSISVTLSIGTYVAPHGADPELVLHRADQALYEAKQAGRGRTVGANT